MEQNRKAGQNPPRVVAPTEEEEEETFSYLRGPRDMKNILGVPPWKKKGAGKHRTVVCCVPCSVNEDSFCVTPVGT